MSDQNIFLLFAFSITLHNIEEALWLPQWSKYASKFHRQVSKDEFHFAVIVITLLAYLSVGFFIFYPEKLIFKYWMFGFIGAMIINVIVPHLISTVILKRYSPGLISGMLLIVPINSILIANSLKSGIITLQEILISSVNVGILLLALIPILIKLGKNLLEDIV